MTTLFVFACCENSCKDDLLLLKCLLEPKEDNLSLEAIEDGIPSLESTGVDNLSSPKCSAGTDSSLVKVIVDGNLS